MQKEEKNFYIPKDVLIPENQNDYLALVEHKLSKEMPFIDDALLNGCTSERYSAQQYLYNFNQLKQKELSWLKENADKNSGLTDFFKGPVTWNEVLLKYVGFEFNGKKA